MNFHEFHPKDILVSSEHIIRNNILVTLHHNWDNLETWLSFWKVNEKIAVFFLGGEGGSYLWDSYPCCAGYTYRTLIILLTELIKQSPFFMNIMLKHKLQFFFLKLKKKKLYRLHTQCQQKRLDPEVVELSKQHLFLQLYCH